MTCVCTSVYTIPNLRSFEWQLVSLTALFASRPHLTVFFLFLPSVCENKAGQTVLYEGMFLTTARHQLCQGMKRCVSVGSCAITLFNLQSIKLLSYSDIAKLKIIKIQMTWW